jgi:hypothetical protein
MMPRDMGIYHRTQQEKMGIPICAPYSSSPDKSLDEISSMIRNFNPMKDWVKVSAGLTDLSTDSGMTIEDLKNSFIKKESEKMLKKVQDKVTPEIKDNMLVTMIIEGLKNLSGTTE